MSYFRGRGQGLIDSCVAIVSALSGYIVFNLLHARACITADLNGPDAQRFFITNKTLDTGDMLY